MDSLEIRQIATGISKSAIERIYWDKGPVPMSLISSLYNPLPILDQGLSVTGVISITKNSSYTKISIYMIVDGTGVFVDRVQYHGYQKIEMEDLFIPKSNKPSFQIEGYNRPDRQITLQDLGNGSRYGSIKTPNDISPRSIDIYFKRENPADLGRTYFYPKGVNIDLRTGKIQTY